MYETLTFEISDHIAHVVFNRPRLRNAMNVTSWRELGEVFNRISEAPEARVAVLSSTGPHFSAGIDLKSLGSLLDASGEVDEGRRREALMRIILELQDTVSALEKCRVPVLVAVQGGCIGGGVDIISASDMRYCTEDAYFVIKETEIGMTADLGTLQRLPHLIPAGAMRELAFTGRDMAANEAREIGLVNQVYVDHESMLAGVMEIARQIAAHSPLAQRGVKEMLNYARDHSVADGLNYIAVWNAAMIEGSEMMEAMAARRGKRAATFNDLLERIDIDPKPKAAAE